MECNPPEHKIHSKSITNTLLCAASTDNLLMWMITKAMRVNAVTQGEVIIRNKIRSAVLGI